MGTNYYLKTKEKTLHIGKSSAGWCFSLHAIPEESLTSLATWTTKLNQYAKNITDDNGNKLTVGELLVVITTRSWTHKDYYDIEHDAKGYITYKPCSQETWLNRNSAIPGPNGLARHKQDDRYCLGHEGGTWDLMLGDFS